jgi:4-hydroxythreonine-4-phosphate dehydrogenase
VLSYYKKLMNLEEFSYSPVRGKGQFTAKVVNVVNCWEDMIEITPGKPSTATAAAARLCLAKAVEEIKEGLLDALVTGPIDKNTIHSQDFPYRGHTEYLNAVFDTSDSLMLMTSPRVRVGLLSEHVPLKEAAGLVTAERFEAKLKLLENSLRKDFGITKPRIAVLGLNPHAGDEGLIGNEEGIILRPVVEGWKTKGKLVFGPYPADGFFASGQYMKYDGILAMYHDQGLIPFKSLAFEEGVNYTAGLPIVRTSPDHGTAYSIAGKNLARESSMRAAIYLAGDLARTRNLQLVEN